MARELKYPEIDVVPQCGDIVKFLGDPQAHSVEEVIVTNDALRKWGVQRSGIMIVGPTYGRVFDELDEGSEVRFVSRGGTFPEEAP